MEVVRNSSKYIHNGTSPSRPEVSYRGMKSSASSVKDLARINFVHDSLHTHALPRLRRLVDRPGTQRRAHHVSSQPSHRARRHSVQWQRGGRISSCRLAPIHLSHFRFPFHVVFKRHVAPLKVLLKIRQTLVLHHIFAVVLLARHWPTRVELEPSIPNLCFLLPVLQELLKLRSILIAPSVRIHNHFLTLRLDLCKAPGRRRTQPNASQENTPRGWEAQAETSEGLHAVSLTARCRRLALSRLPYAACGTSASPYQAQGATIYLQSSERSS